ETVRYFCSSDTDSLDAVVIPAHGIVILDGTPPHATEPLCPGAVDLLVNLTEFWNTAYLQKASEAVKLLSQSISSSYRRVYALMAAIHEIENAISVATEEVFDQNRAETIILRLLEKHRIREENTPAVFTQPSSAFGVKGYVHLNSYENNAQTVIRIKDRVIYSEYFFKLLKHALLRNKISFYESVRPVDEITDSLFLPQSSILFTRHAALEKCDGVINLDRMLPERGKGALASHKTLLREIDSLCQNIEKLLHEIGKRHDELESYYIAATDYKALNRFSESFISSLFASS
ncbi:MAG: hypothetical protein IJD35_08405, partial [Clostridia bacterium]|nr:hypothetical protein [Clostridia bacterium]